MKNGSKRLWALLMIPAVLACTVSFAGCGAKEEYDDYAEYDDYEDYDGYEDDVDVEDPGDEEEEIAAEGNDASGYEEENPVEKMKNRPADYDTENEVGELASLNYAPVEVTVEDYCDDNAIAYAEEKNCRDHLLWLADYAVNSVEPQAVNKLLKIPALAEAARVGEISRYISVYVTNNDVNQYGAMEETCYLGKDGHGIEEWDSPMYYLGHKILINLNSFGPGSADDPERLRFLESSMIHELMHAFMADYLMNMSLGTGRDGARVLERDADGKPREGEDGRPVLVDEIPGWLQEGLAMTVEDGYNTRREELRDFFGVDHYDEEYLTILSTPESVAEALNPEYEDGEIVNMAQVTIEENTYNMGYVATLALCSFAGEKLGYKVFDENGVMNSEALFYGLNDILVRIHEGNSLDRVIADISRDPSTGEPAYADTTDFEKKCFGSAKDPGLIFLQKMLFDYEARSQKDPEQYIPCGSVLPGYVNGAQYCMDGFYHEPAQVYEVANTEEGNPEGDYFSISTIRMSKVALTGGRRTSYDPYGDPLTGAEEDERDSCYIGEEKRYVDASLEDD